MALGVQVEMELVLIFPGEYAEVCGAAFKI
jgi:hypothetical protein